VTLLCTPSPFIVFSRMRALSPDGRCRAFSSLADGTGWSEGAGILLLTRLSEARRRGLPVLALLPGSAINQDGRSQGLTAPHGPSQQRVIRAALASAGLSPDAIDAVEAHGTGTLLGDPIEVGALLATYGEARPPDRPLLLGAIKSNLGHTQAAAGIAGVMKLVLALQHQRLPRTLHVETPTTHVDWSSGAIQLLREPAYWPSGDRPRRAGVSSFGISGTNAHVIVEEAPLEPTPPADSTRPTPDAPLLLSARNVEALRRQAGRLADWLAIHPQTPWAAIVRTAAISRAGLPTRAVVQAGDPQEALLALRALEQGLPDPRLTCNTSSERQRVAFVYPGQGGQWVGMGRALLAEDPVFAAAIDACDAALRPHTGWSLRTLLVGEPGTPDLEAVEVVQPALFGMGYALTQSWRALGIEPAAVIGHSQGEVVAAVVAGALSLEDGARVVAVRSRMLTRLAGTGTMAAVLLPVEALLPRLSDRSLWIAVVNAPDRVVVSGTAPSVEALLVELELEGIPCRRVAVNYASHCPLVDPILSELAEALRTLMPRAPSLPMVSTVTGRAVSDTIVDGDYWCRNLRDTVRFDVALQALLEQGIHTFVEISTHPILAQCITESSAPSGRVVPSLRRNEGGRSRLLRSLGELHVHGLPVEWSALLPGDRVVSDLPTYAFARERYWPETTQTLRPSFHVQPGPEIHLQSLTPESSMLRRNDDGVKTIIEAILRELTWLSSDQLDDGKSLIALGIDSLKIMSLQSVLRERHGVALPNAIFMDGTTSIRDLAERAAALLPAGSEPGHQPMKRTPAQENAAQPHARGLADPHSASPGNAPVAIEGVAQLMAEQLRAMSELTARQLETLQQLGFGGLPRVDSGSPSAETVGSSPPHASQTSQLSTGREQSHPGRPASHSHEIHRTAAPSRSAGTRPAAFVPYKSLAERAASAPAHPDDYLEALVTEFCRRTPTSKARTQQDRLVFASNRNISGLTPALKEMTYQVIAEKASGSRFWDVDGNEFIDLTMGFGSSLLGHGHPAIADALKTQLDAIWAVGPISSQAGEVARRVCDMTGLERVAFFNSGTEAVMVAIRLARTATRRPKIVIFAGSYHGMFDGVLAAARPGSIRGEAAPISPGVPQSMVEDTLVLNYDDPESLAIIESCAPELAAVLVEPVQSRRPDVQPHAFLRQLRELTERTGVALVFDEVITGFRVSQGGAQAWFGVQADLATYGKVIGGGLPIGLVAGSARFMDGIDGGMWQFGDASFPMATNTFVAGTFCSHPLTMASARALLDVLTDAGPALQRELTSRTRSLCARLNSLFADEGVPIHVVHFASLFRFEMPPEYAIFFHRLVSRGIYVWELRNCCLTTAHSDADIEQIIEVVRDTSRWLASTVALNNPASHPEFGLKHVAASRVQSAMFERATIPGGDAAYHVPVALSVRGPLRLERLEVAMTEVVRRHESLRTCFRKQDDQLLLRIHPVGDFELTYERIEETQIPSFLEQLTRPFDLGTPTLFRCMVAELGVEHFILAINAHHLIVDGLSMDIVLEDLLQLYDQRELPPIASSYSAYVEWEKEYLESEKIQQDSTFWKAHLAGKLPRTLLPGDFPREASRSFEGKFATFTLSDPGAVRTLARARAVTNNMLLNAVFQVFLATSTVQAEILYGSPTSGRPDHRFVGVVGLFIGVGVYRTRIAADMSFGALLNDTRSSTLALLDAQHYPFERLAREFDPTHGRMPLFDIGFSFEASQGRSRQQLRDLSLSPYPLPARGLSMDVVLECLDDGDNFRMRFNYNPRHFRPETVQGWASRFDQLAQWLLANPDVPLSDLKPIDPQERPVRTPFEQSWEKV